MLKGVPKKYRTQSLRFFEKFFAINLTQNNSKILKMTPVDVMNLDKMLTVNSMWKNKFFEAWAKAGAGLV